MSLITYNQNATMSVKGITPLMGAGITLLASPELQVISASAGDYLAETYQVDPSTTATALSMGKITTAHTLWLQTDRLITVTLTQTSGDVALLVDNFLMTNSTFTAVKLANASGTTANVAVVILGDRNPPSGPGIF